MTFLNLGVVVIPYAHLPKEFKRNARKNGVPGTETTADVAGWLENKYHVMEIFYELHQNEIAKSIENSYAGQIENVLSGAPLPQNPLIQTESFIDTKFRQFLLTGEMETLGYPGVPTQAALDGVNHRMKSGYNKNRARRPSFIDTGLYEASMKAWFE